MFSLVADQRTFLGIAIQTRKIIRNTEEEEEEQDEYS